VNITKLRRLPCLRYAALSWLPFSCYLVGARMAKVELEDTLNFTVWGGGRNWKWLELSGMIFETP
jgi:hypothetical protein